jgi:hypothetical protein
MVEEIRRIQKRPEDKNRKAYLEACIESRNSKLDLLIYYGVYKKVIEDPLNPNNSKLSMQERLY